MGKLEPTDIRRVWPRIKPDVENLLRETGADFFPEHVFAKCLNGVAHLYTASEGWVVLEPQRNPYTLDYEILVWLAYGKGVNLIEMYQAQIDAIAREAGATRLVFYSPRRGFERVAPAFGWTPVTTMYEKKL